MAKTAIAIHSVPVLSIVIPTYNESGNVARMIDALAAALAGVDWEAIFVDDNSPDGTAALVKHMTQTNSRVRCIKRLGRRGLSSAAVEGFMSSSAPYIALIDADMQHDEGKLKLMLQLLGEGRADIVIGTRYSRHGSAEGLSSKRRRWLSRMGGRLAHHLLRVETSDPMSGFFMMSRAVFDELAPRLSAHGFKILVDILTSSSAPLHVQEVPYVFRERHSGASKLDLTANLDYLLLLLDKLTNGLLPPRFILFSVIGLLGVGVHLAVLRLAQLIHLPSFASEQGLAAFMAMTGNFFLNNLITYRDRRLRGLKLWRGLLSFYLVCSIGFAANVGIAHLIYQGDQRWWLAGVLGAIIGAVWNYAATSALTWSTRR